MDYCSDYSYSSFCRYSPHQSTTDSLAAHLSNYRCLYHCCFDILSGSSLSFIFDIDSSLTAFAQSTKKTGFRNMDSYLTQVIRRGSQSNFVVIQSDRCIQ